MGAVLSSIVHHVTGKMREIGADDRVNYAMAKVRKIGADDRVNHAMAKVREKGSEIGASNWVNLLLEKLKQGPVVLLNSLTNSVMGKMRDIGADDRLERCVQVAKRHPAVVVLLVLYWLSRGAPGGSSVVRIITAPVRWLCYCGLVVLKMMTAPVRWLLPKCGGAAGKTMKAPGRNKRIPRAPFESNPAEYFRDLRGK